MTGFTFPVCIRSARMVRSFLVNCARNVPMSWLTNGDSISNLIGLTSGPISPWSPGPPPPIMTAFPLRVRTPLHSSSQRHRFCLLKCYVGRFQDYCAIGENTDVLREGACSPAKHFIAGFELHHVFADRFNGPGVINAEPFDLWFQHSRV